MIDEDPGSIQHRYLGSLTTKDDLPEVGLNLLEDDRKHNLVVILRPRLEEWVLAAAGESGLNVDDYGLNARRLHRVINAKGEVSPRSAGSPFQQIQRVLLEAEGVVFDERGRVDLDRFGWP